MANPAQLSALIANLQQNSAAYDFFQALFLLEQCYAESLFKKVQLYSASQLTFPASDIKSTNQDLAKNRLKFDLSFMGFYGVDSPLPQYFSAALLTETNDNKIIKEFLNIFNQRPYQLLYRAYKKYKLSLQCKDKNSHYIKYLIALSGKSLHQDDLDEFAFAGVMGARNRNANGLIGLLRDYLTLNDVSVNSYIPHWIDTDKKLILGWGEMCLGQNTLMGNKVVDINGKISIQIGSISVRQAEELLPQNTKGQRLQHLIKRYLGPLITFDVILKIDLANLDCLVLGKNKIQLGWLLNLGNFAATTHSVIINANS